MNTYKVQLLMMQRKVSYPGELAPEAVAVVDEYTLDENPDWWPAEVERQKSSIGDEAEAWAEVTVLLDQGQLDAALTPVVARVDGVIQDQDAQ